MVTPSVELKPPGQVMQEVFLSPKVLDREAFETFSGALRVLIERAAEQTAALAVAATQAERAQARLAEQQQALEARSAALQTSMQLVAAQAEEAKRFMNAVEEAGLRLRTIELATNRGIDDARRRLAEVEASTGARLREAVEDAGEQVTRIEQRLAQAEARLKQLSAEGPVQLLRALCERAESLVAPGSADQTSLASLVSRGERVAGWVRAALTDLDQLRQQSEEARRLVAGSILQLAEVADAVEASLPRPTPRASAPTSERTPGAEPRGLS